MLSPAVKIIIGLILIVISLWYIVDGINRYFEPGWVYLLTVIKGLVPLAVLLLGIFIVWLEWDELRIERELKLEEKKPARKKGKK